MPDNIFKKALKIAKTLSYQKYKLVAIITDKKGKVLSFGVNSFEKSHPTQAYYAEKEGLYHKIYLHAEISAIISLPDECTPYAIYILRVNNKNEKMLAKPCKICERAIRDVGIQKVYHT